MYILFKKGTLLACLLLRLLSGSCLIQMIPGYYPTTQWTAQMSVITDGQSLVWEPLMAGAG